MSWQLRVCDPRPSQGEEKGEGLGENEREKP